MYEALVQKNSRFEGVFYAAIKTTGIFCRPSCSARKPRPENVEYFQDVKSALAGGYRACKICKPLSALGETPEWLAPLLDEVERDAKIRLRAADLRKRGLDPTRIRRWFQKTHGMTFSTFLRMRRINQAIGRIHHEELVTDVAVHSGYESVSGFSSGFKKIAGATPSELQSDCVIACTRLPTPLGPVLVGAVDEGICLLEFTDRPMLETQISRLKKRLKTTALPGSSPYFAQLHQQLQEYFEGQRKRFDLPLVVPGTEFQQMVWEQLQKIPHGSTRSYAEQARHIGNPSAVRAVAKANGDNRISILIPCHRVIGTDGSLTGYGGGLWRKKRLLEIEQAEKMLNC